MALFPWPVNVSTVGGVVGGSVVSRVRGRLYLTILAKATFELRADADMVPTVPQPLAIEEQLHVGASRSVRTTPDLAPYLPAADVVFTGHAHTHHGPAKGVDARLAVFGQRVLIDKTVLVRSPEPFERMPVVYELAYGGPGFAPNPIGTGREEGSPPPSLLDPDAPTRSVGCFAPIAASWPTRANALKPGHASALRGPIHEIPDDFDWSYYLVAPVDQRAPYLIGDEWLLLKHLHASRAELRSRLPHAHAWVRILWTPKGDATAPTALPADTLVIDGDAGVCSLVFRGVFPLPDGERMSQTRAAVAVSVANAEIDWSRATFDGRADDLSTTLARAASAAREKAVPLGGTLILPEREAAPDIVVEPPAKSAMSPWASAAAPKKK